MTEQYQAAICKVWKEALSTEEKLILLEQLSGNEAGWKASLLQQYELDVDNGTQYLQEQRSAVLLQQLHERIRLMDEAATCIETGTKVVRMHSYVLRRVAGIVAAALIIAGFFWYPSGKKVAIDNNIIALHKPGHEYKRFINQADKEWQFMLKDGSEVKLSPGAAIVWTDGFTEAERKVQLSGQAWFDVAKDSRRPFSVDAGGITTTALGTKFMVNTLRNNKVAVELFEGKVKIESKPGASSLQTVFLEPGQQCIIDAQWKVMISDLAVGKPAAGDLPDKQQPEKNSPVPRQLKPLEFVQTPLVDVLAQLGQRYKVHFKYDAAEISNDQVTGTFLASDSLNVTLKLLRSINNLSYSKYQDTILVNKPK